MRLLIRQDGKEHAPLSNLDSGAFSFIDVWITPQKNIFFHIKIVLKLFVELFYLYRKNSMKKPPIFRNFCSNVIVFRPSFHGERLIGEPIVG